MGHHLMGFFNPDSSRTLSGPDGYPRGRPQTRTRPAPFRVPEPANPRGKNCTRTHPHPHWVWNPRVSGPDPPCCHPYWLQGYIEQKKRKNLSLKKTTSIETLFIRSWESNQTHDQGFTWSAPTTTPRSNMWLSKWLFFYIHFNESCIEY